MLATINGTCNHILCFNNWTFNLNHGALWATEGSLLAFLKEEEETNEQISTRRKIPPCKNRRLQDVFQKSIY